MIMCGILAIYNLFHNSTLTKELTQQLEQIQHRGRESYGFSLLSNKKNLYNYKDLKEIKNNKLTPGNFKIGLGQNRYATSYDKKCLDKEKKLFYTQPFTGNHDMLGEFVLIHNGNIPNIRDMAIEFGIKDFLELEELNSKYKLNDSLILLKIIEKSIEKNWFNILVNIVKKIEGSFSLILLDVRFMELYCLRDKNGNRPLVVGSNNRGYCLCSESVGLGEYKIIREIRNGEIVKINDFGIHSLFKYNVNIERKCLFEYIYFMHKETKFRPKRMISYDFDDNDATTFNVEQLRYDFGEELARKETYIFDNKNRNDVIVVGAPNTGIPSGKAFAYFLDLQYVQFIEKRKNEGRSFILPDNKSRIEQIKRKFIFKEDVDLENKIIFFIDDSIVRGNTLEIIIKMLKKFNPKEIHIRISSPEVIEPCYYGIDIPTKKELLMNNISKNDFCKKNGIDSLVYLTVNEILYPLKRKYNEYNKNNYCTGCFNGKYLSNNLLEF